MNDIGPTRRGILKGMLALGVAVAVPAFRLTERAYERTKEVATTAVREVTRRIKGRWWLTAVDEHQAEHEMRESWRIDQAADDERLRVMFAPYRDDAQDEIILEAVEAEEVVA